MSRRGERAVVAELLCADPAPLDLDFPAGAGQVMGRVDRPADPGAVAGDDGAPAVPVPALAAVWCRSVGATWTVELHELDPGAALGTIVDWISSGVPISEPAPKAATARKLLTERGFQLFPDSSAGPSCPHRYGIGYTCRDSDLIEAGTRGAPPGRGPAGMWAEAGDSKGSVVSRQDNPRRRRTREDYQRGLPGYHDPTAGFGGSTPARSALTLRAVLAGFGLLVCTVAAVLMIRSGLTALGVVFVVVALVDLGWVIHRKRRGEPG